MCRPCCLAWLSPCLAPSTQCLFPKACRLCPLLLSCPPGGCDNGVKMWNLATNQTQQLAAHAAPVRHVFFIQQVPLWALRCGRVALWVLCCGMIRCAVMLRTVLCCLCPALHIQQVLLPDLSPPPPPPVPAPAPAPRCPPPSDEHACDRQLGQDGQVLGHAQVSGRVGLWCSVCSCVAAERGAGAASALHQVRSTPAARTHPLTDPHARAPAVLPPSMQPQRGAHAADA